ncbi:MAG: hypothetical protein AAGF31_06415 [Planctomycetota bacterium]
MIKKTLITTLSVTLAAGLLFGSNALSYLKTACGRVSQAAEDSVPVEFQIDRARQMVADLAPEVRNSMHVIAKEEIALQNLNEQITKAEAKTEKSRDEILRLQSDLSDGRQVFRYAGHSYSRDEVTEDLSRRFNRFKVTDETLAHLKSMRDARAKNLDAARQKLTAMVSAQKKLETDITNLEAKRKLVEVAQASSDVIFDDSQLARAKELITDIRTKLDVAAKLASADVDVHAEIPLDAAQSEDVTEQVAAYFHLDAKPSIEVKVAKVSLSQE